MRKSSARSFRRVLGEELAGGPLRKPTRARSSGSAAKCVDRRGAKFAKPMPSVPPNFRAGLEDRPMWESIQQIGWVTILRQRRS